MKKKCYKLSKIFNRIKIATNKQIQILKYLSKFQILHY